jgi:hypothetical protein
VIHALALASIQKPQFCSENFFPEHHTHSKAPSTYLQTFAPAASDPSVTGMFIQIFIKKPMKQSINNDGYQNAA